MNSKTTPHIFIFFLLANLLAFANGGTINSFRGQNWGYFCSDSGNYTSNSLFAINVKSTLSSLSSNIDQYGFYNSSLGQSPDTVYANVLCRGDVHLDMCHSCIKNATDLVVQVCPNQKQAFLWGAFCKIRYSNESLYGNMASYPWYYSQTGANVTNPTEYLQDLKTLLTNLRNEAANSTHKVAGGNITMLNFELVYGLVQCTPDISSGDCISCLIAAPLSMDGFIAASTGVEIDRPSCSIAYAINNDFMNHTRLSELEMVNLPPLLLSPPPLSSPKEPTPPVLSPSGPGKDKKNNRQISIIIGAVVAGVVLVILFVILAFIRRIKPKPVEQQPERVIVADEINVVDSLQYDFGKIKIATSDFSETRKLGEGGFGDVYQGKLVNGQTIAVKRLSQDSSQGDLEFKNEVVLLARLQHRNLVRLLGYAMEGKEKLLVYEFLENGSLDRFIFDSTKRSRLDWDTRHKIMGGIAKGLLYLHEDSRLRIIHRDMKSSNVLLDEEMNPKIADFGMARLFVQEETQANTNRIVGTYGYMAPEYALLGEFSVKTDVFSFGVLVLEIITGQKNINFHNGKKLPDCLISNAWKNWNNGMAASLIDRTLWGSSSVPPDILRSIHIGLLCVQENAAARPSMALVVQMLHNSSMTLPVPSEPAYLSPSEYGSEFSNSTEQHDRTRSSFSSSKELSNSELYPR